MDARSCGGCPGNRSVRIDKVSKLESYYSFTPCQAPHLKQTISWRNPFTRENCILILDPSLQLHVFGALGFEVPLVLIFCPTPCLTRQLI